MLSVVVLPSMLLVLLTSSVWADTGAGSNEHICYDDEGVIVLQCPESDECYLDDLEHPICLLKDQPVAHCDLRKEEFLLLEVHEECVPFSRECPENKVCCSSQSGYHCVLEEEYKRIRDDVHIRR